MQSNEIFKWLFGITNKSKFIYPKYQAYCENHDLHS